MTASNIFFTVFAIALSCAALPSRVTATDLDQAHTIFDDVLRQNVRNAHVDYAALKAHPQDLNRYLDQVAAVSKAEFKKWTEPRQIAFLINAYNAYTLRLIIDHYPIKSIKDIGRLFKGPWDQPVVQLFGETMDLKKVEHEILRVDYAEPRIHFALVCAAKGCPPLRNEAFVGARLEEQLVDQAKQFLADATKNRVDAVHRMVYLSSIFKWYGSDFEKKSGSVLAALQPYWPEEVVTTDGFKIRFTDYDWSLNAMIK